MTGKTPAIIELEKELVLLERDACVLRDALQVLLVRNGNSRTEVSGGEKTPSHGKTVPESEWEPRVIEMLDGSGMKLKDLHEKLTENGIRLEYRELINWIKRTSRRGTIEKISRGTWRRSIGNAK